MHVICHLLLCFFYFTSHSRTTKPFSFTDLYSFKFQPMWELEITCSYLLYITTLYSHRSPFILFTSSSYFSAPFCWVILTSNPLLLNLDYIRVLMAYYKFLLVSALILSTFETMNYGFIENRYDS